MATLLKLLGARAATPEALRAGMTAAEEEIRTARAEADRLIAAAGNEVDDHKAEDLLRRARAQERAARRAEARIPELREKLAEGLWAAREQAFHRYKKQLTAAAKKAITAFETAGEANVALASIKQAASAELGANAALVPTIVYAGIVLPDLIATWRKYTERALEAMERQELPRPALPTPANDRRPMLDPRPGAVVLVHGVPLPEAADASRAKPAKAPPAQPPAPPPRREQRHDGPPGPGQRQIKFMRGGTFTLPDGTSAAFGDRVNLAEAEAEKIVRTGAADFVEVPPAVVGEAKMKINVSELLGSGR